MQVEQKPPPITVILTNWRRPRNIPKIMAAMEAQTVQPVIQLVDNAPLRHPLEAMMDRVAVFPFGSSSYGMLLLAFFAETEWIARISDDIIPNDNKFLEDALEIAKKRPDAITGLRGRKFNREAPHYGRIAQYGNVEIVAGHFVIFRKKILEKVRLYLEPIHKKPEFRLRCDDIYLSLEVGKGKPVHWADEGLFQRMGDLPHGGAGMVMEGGDHVGTREAICAAYADVLKKEGA